jgi:hypothetical protein
VIALSGVEVRVWTDFAYRGFENGTVNRPYDTLTEALAAVPAFGVLMIKAGTTPATALLNKPMRIRAYGGAVTIGR